MEQYTENAGAKEIFVLDIGTRFVRGVICERADGGSGRLVVRHVEIFEHEERAMFAGQVHDIDKVARTVNRVKTQLEHRIGRRITAAACAVAGRNLYTCRGESSLQRAAAMDPVSLREIQQLELAAVQNALESTFRDETAREYYCVDYSPREHRLDGEPIKNLLGHRGRAIDCEVLVTLLPYKVLESMFTVLEKCGLELSFLTLEPIAALEAVVPRDMYFLNLILVDVGAGTSDIAITASGKVTAYGMVPQAGDEITEVLSRSYLVDFLEAERIKRECGSRASDPEASVGYTDMFGRTHEKPVSEILNAIRPRVRELAARIHDEVKKLTTCEFLTEYAVILVGGGSLTPFLEEEVSDAFTLPRERVGVRFSRSYAGIVNETGRLTGPESATCMGIALFASRQKVLSLTYITVNDTHRTLLRMNDEKLTVLSALLACGFNMRQIYGLPGMARTFTLNGELKTVKGRPPVPAVLKVNGEDATLETVIGEGDRLTVVPAVDGSDAGARVGDVLPPVRSVRYNGEEAPLPSSIVVNGAEVPSDAEVPDRGEVRVVEDDTLTGFLASRGIDLGALSERRVSVIVNGTAVTRRARNYRLSVNGTDLAVVPGAEYRLSAGDLVEFAPGEPLLRVRDFVPEPVHGADLKVRVNGEDYTFPGGRGKILLNGENAGPDDHVNNCDIVNTFPGKDAEALLVHIFQHMNINPHEQSGRRLRLLINDEDAQFSSPLFEGADVKVLFE